MLSSRGSRLVPMHIADASQPRRSATAFRESGHLQRRCRGTPDPCKATLKFQKPCVFATFGFRYRGRVYPCNGATRVQLFISTRRPRPARDLPRVPWPGGTRGSDTGPAQGRSGDRTWRAWRCDDQIFNFRGTPTRGKTSSRSHVLSRPSGQLLRSPPMSRGAHGLG